METLTTTQVQYNLKKDIRRIIRAPELNGYAQQLGMQISINRFGNKYYLWTREEYQKLLELIKN